MNFRCPHFRAGVALTGFLAVLAFQVARIPLLEALGPLSLALLLGIAARAFLHVPEHQHVGIGFSARHLLRIGIVLVGVRLDFELIARAGPRLFVLAASVITVGLLLFTWLGRRCGLPGVLPVLLAVDSSICGASAVAAAAPVIRARDEDIALVIPLCSLIGTAGVIGLTTAQHVFNLAPTTFGVLSGATLHEIAQVMAAASAVPNALEPGAVTKLMRVALLAPAVLILSFLLARGKGGTGVSLGHLLRSVWFVFGFLLLGLLNTAVLAAFPTAAPTIQVADRHILELATFLMAMAMAAVGLQVDFSRLREQGPRVALVAVGGWLILVALAGLEIYVLRL